jgi:hypothetical protein
MRGHIGFAFMGQGAEGLAGFHSQGGVVGVNLRVSALAGMRMFATLEGYS